MLILIYSQPNYSHRQLSYCNTLFSFVVSRSQCSFVFVISNTVKILTI